MLDNRSKITIAWPTQEYWLGIATVGDAADILGVLEHTADGLRAIGKHHWDGKHTIETVVHSIQEADVFLLRDRPEAAVATVTVSSSPPSIHQDSDREFWSEPGARAAYIRRLAVVPTHQHSGLASQLLKLAESHAASLGTQFARLDTDPLFPEIVQFYTGRDYAVRGMRDGRPFLEKRLGLVEQADATEPATRPAEGKVNHPSKEPLWIRS